MNINQILKKKIKTADSTLIKKMIGLTKRARSTKLLTALDIEPMDILLIKRKLLFIRRLANNPYTNQLIENILYESKKKQKNH